MRSVEFEVPPGNVHCKVLYNALRADHRSFLWPEHSKILRRITNSIPPIRRGEDLEHILPPSESEIWPTAGRFSIPAPTRNGRGTRPSVASVPPRSSNIRILLAAASMSPLDLCRRRSDARTA